MNWDMRRETSELDSLRQSYVYEYASKDFWNPCYRYVSDSSNHVKGTENGLQILPQ